MDFNLNKMSYSLLLSHTFPGLLLEAEILVAFQLFTPLKPLTTLHAASTNNLPSVISLLSFLFVIATILGFILDGIHHNLFKKRESTCDSELYRRLTSTTRMSLVRHFLDDDLWYPYEAYANILIALCPGIVILPYGLHTLQVHPVFILLLTAVLAAVLRILYVEARDTLEQYKDAAGNLLAGFKLQDAENAEHGDAHGRGRKGTSDDDAS